MKLRRFYTPRYSIDRRRFLAKVGQGLGLATVASIYAEAQGIQTPANVRIVTGDQTPTAPSSNAALLKPSDFRYLGAMRVPEEISSFSYGGLTARTVNGRLQFFMVGENSPNAVANWGSFEPVWEFVDTQSYNVDYTQAPRATVLTKWGDIYQGRRKSWDSSGKPIALQYLVTRGLLWKNNRLYWNFYDTYNVTSRPDWHIGMTDLRSGPASIVAYGPWRANVGVKHGSYWMVDMPDGTMGIGSGFTSGNIGSSWGPELWSGSPFPGDNTPSGYGAPDLNVSKHYVGYEFAGGDLASDGSLLSGHTLKSLQREGSYVWHPQGTVVDVDPLKNGGIGSFTDIDYVNSCAYINLPDKQGLFFAGNLGTGHVWYGNTTNCGHGLGNPCGGGQGPNASAFKSQFWIYDPAECARVVAGQKAPNLMPTYAFDPSATIHPMQMGCTRSFGGLHFDAASRNLYIMAYQADVSTSGYPLPLIHVFHIN
jgi:hypothetical protein